MMTFSDANPVQFWLTDCDTYNEEVRYGQNNRCFCAPWQCDDEIKTQLQDEAGLHLSLLVYDEDESELDEIPFEETSDGVYFVSFIPGENTPDICDKKILLKVRENAEEDEVPVSLPALADYDTTTGTPPTLDTLADWINASSGPNPGAWSISPPIDASCNGSGGVQGYVCGEISTNEAFDYEFDVQVEIQPSGGVNPISIDIIFGLLDSGFNELDTVTFTYTTLGVKTPNFTLNPSGNGTYLGMRIVNNTPFDTHSFELQAASYTPGPVSYEWTLGVNPTVNLPGTGLSPKQSEMLWVDATFIAGVEYTVTAAYTRTVNSGSSNPRTSTLMILNSSDVVQFSNAVAGGAGANTLSVVFIANVNTTRIGFIHNSGSDVDITVTAITATRVQTVGTTRVLAKSDCLNLKETHDDTLLLTYSNYRNYAGIINNNGSPDLTFYLRIPAVFNEERFPETDEPMQLSNNRIISLNSQVKKQRLLETDQLPNYMRLKLSLVLKHQFLTIEEKDFVKEEPLEEVENSNKRWPMRRMTCWLTEKEYVVRNIL
jgi:hypothetical protein